MGKTNLILVAGGRPSKRLEHLTKSVPKCLLTFGGKTGLELLRNSLPMDKFDKVILVVLATPMGDMIANYYNNILDGKAEVIRQHVQSPQGTAGAVTLAMYHFPADHYFISWCDLIPEEPITKLPSDDAIYVSDDLECRYVYKDGKMEMGTGNVVGMYYCHNIFFPVLHDGEFADLLANAIAEDECLEPTSISIKVFDYGVPKTYEATKNRLTTSAHASVELTTIDAIKHIKDYSTFESEVNWYRYAPPPVKRYVPEMKAFVGGSRVPPNMGIPTPHESTITLERVHGICPNDSDSDEMMKEVLAQACFVLNEYFHSYQYPNDPGDVTGITAKGYITNPFDRCKYTHYLLGGKDTGLLQSNLCAKSGFTLITNQLVQERIIHALYTPALSFIHGDPTLQNMIVRDNGRICFIDPKGKFADMRLFGDPKYDFAKIYYSLVGNYDGFNKGEYEVEQYEDGSWNYVIKPGKWSHLGDWFLDHLEQHYSVFAHQIKLIHALIWLRVTGYIWPQSLEQAIVAYLHGTRLLNECIPITKET